MIKEFLLLADISIRATVKLTIPSEQNANDDASGVSAVLEIARVMCKEIFPQQFLLLSPRRTRIERFNFRESKRPKLEYCCNVTTI